MERAPNNLRCGSQRCGRRRKCPERCSVRSWDCAHPRSPKWHHFLSPSIFSQFVVSCDFDVMPNVIFHIQGQEFPLPPSAYTIQVGVSLPLPGSVSNLPNVSNPGRTPQSPSYGCRPSFAPTYNNMWILGNVFIRHYYTIFSRSQHRLGLAKAKWSSRGQPVWSGVLSSPSRCVISHMTLFLRCTFFHFGYMSKKKGILSYALLFLLIIIGWCIHKQQKKLTKSSINLIQLSGNVNNDKDQVGNDYILMMFWILEGIWPLTTLSNLVLNVS